MTPEQFMAVASITIALSSIVLSTISNRKKANLDFVTTIKDEVEFLRRKNSEIKDELVALRQKNSELHDEVERLKTKLQKANDDLSACISERQRLEKREIELLTNYVKSSLKEMGEDLSHDKIETLIKKKIKEIHF